MAAQPGIARVWVQLAQAWSWAVTAGAGTGAYDDRTIRDYAPAPQPPAAGAMPLATVLDAATFEVPVDALTGRRADTTTPADELRRETGRQLDDIHFQLLTCRVDELHPHPSYVRHHLTVPASKLSALAERDDLALREPLVITRDHTIIDGYARWEIARQRGRPTLPCIEYELTEAEALHWLIQRHRRSNGLNDFSRILLALDLEPLFKAQALSNQRAGGQKKGSSKLTEAEKLDCRSEIAAAAGVSAGSVTKVKQLTRTAHPELVQGLRSGQISIHRAWLWSKGSTEKQWTELMLYQGKRSIKKKVRTLVSQHRPKSLPTVFDPGNLFRRLSALESSKFGPVDVFVIDALPGRAVFLTKGLFRDIDPQEELMPPCATNSR